MTENPSPYMVGGKNVRKMRTSVELYVGQSRELEKIARSLGYLQTRGAGAHVAGSVSKMLQAIAAGKLKVEANNGA